MILVNCTFVESLALYNKFCYSGDVACYLFNPFVLQEFGVHNCQPPFLEARSVLLDFHLIEGFLVVDECNA